MATSRWAPTVPSGLAVVLKIVVAPGVQIRIPADPFNVIKLYDELNKER